MSGAMDVVIAAGVESMTRVPMGLSSVLPAKSGFGKPKSPRQEARYPDVVFSQFTGAEMMAKKYGLSKDELDEFGFESHQKAIAATQKAASSTRRSCRSRSPCRTARATMHTSDEGIRFDATLDGDQGREAAARGRPHHRGDLEPDLRRRVGRAWSSTSAA